MSKKAATDFVKRAETDLKMRKIARDRFGDVVKVGVEHGYKFTKAEFNAALRARRKPGAPKQGHKDDPDTCICCVP